MKTDKNELVIYQNESGELELNIDNKENTIWANLNQISKLFDKDKSVISRHIKNIFETKELKERSVVAFFATTATDGKSYNVQYYNLDLILSVGYRVNSKQATKFRQWATKILKSYMVDGYFFVVLGLSLIAVLGLRTQHPRLSNLSTITNSINI